MKKIDSIIVSKMTDSECNWFGSPNGSFMLTVNPWGWFPMEAIFGVIKGKYADTNNVGGVIAGNMGSGSISVTDLEKATQLLADAGYKIEHSIKLV